MTYPSCKANSPPLFGSPIVTGIAKSSFVTDTGLMVPGIIARCFQEINKDLKVEGLFRRSGSASLLNQLQAQFEVTEDPFKVVPSRTVTVHYWTGLLKRYLQLLPEPLIPYANQPSFLKAFETDRKLEQFHQAINAMPLEHRHLFKYLLQSIRGMVDYSDANHMTASAMAIIVAPTCIQIDAVSQLMQQSTPVLEPIVSSASFSWQKVTRRLFNLTSRSKRFSSTSSCTSHSLSSFSTRSVPFPLYQPQYILQLDLVKQSAQWAKILEYLILNAPSFLKPKTRKRSSETAQPSSTRQLKSSGPSPLKDKQIDLTKLEFPESKDLLKIFQDFRLPLLPSTFTSTHDRNEKYTTILKHWRAREEQELEKHASGRQGNSLKCIEDVPFQRVKEEKDGFTKHQVPSSDWLRLWAKKSLLVEPNTPSGNMATPNIQLYHQTT